MQHPTRTAKVTVAEAGAWAEVLVRRRLVHAIVLTHTGQWLVQHQPDSPVRVLPGPGDVVVLAAAIQHRIRATRPGTR
ncbi:MULTISPECIES: hypothetical protein [unclassified Streptomyces]|uniref:hypothetical protein n=1 Tax=unclassified Streptomyces TaxID=2593676 RepID=UPI003643AA62